MAPVPSTFPWSSESARNPAPWLIAPACAAFDWVALATASVWVIAIAVLAAIFPCAGDWTASACICVITLGVALFVCTALETVRLWDEPAAAGTPHNLLVLGLYTEKGLSWNVLASDSDHSLDDHPAMSIFPRKSQFDPVGYAPREIDLLPDTHCWPADTPELNAVFPSMNSFICADDGPVTKTIDLFVVLNHRVSSISPCWVEPIQIPPVFET